jgi:hypothetical protein
LALAAVVGSYLIQTHLGLAPVVGLMLAAVGVLWFRSTHMPQRERGHAALRRPALAGLALLALMWVGPLAQQVTNSPGNLGQIVQFFRHPPPSEIHSHSLRSAIAAVSDNATVFPMGHAPERGHSVGRAAVAGGFGLLALFVVVACWGRHRFLAYLGGLSALGFVIAIVATTRVIGPLERYVLFWTPALVVPPLFAAAMLVIDTVPRMELRRWPIQGLAGRVSVAASVAAMALVCALLVRTAVGSQTISYPASPGARPGATMIEEAVRGNRARVFTMKVTAANFETGTLVLQLVRDGYHFRLTPPYDLYRGSSSHAVDPGLPVILVGTSDLPGARPPAVHLGTVGSLDLWVASDQASPS